MRRRAYLRSAGVLAGAGLAGCLGTGGPPEAANEFDYETTTADGVAVPLVPIADAIEWYENDAAVFADARGRRAYERARIAGALYSPAPDGQSEDDPVEDLATGRRIVTYCGCPHHLSTLRGASLIREGYANTYAIDEGFAAWHEADYPMEGSRVEDLPDLFTIAGRTSPEDAGELAWARHEATGQREAAPIAADGGFLLHLRFYDVTPDSPIRLSVPGGDLTDRLGALADGTVDIRS